VPDLETPRLHLHSLSAEEAETLHAGTLPEGWRYSPAYPLPDTQDGVGLFLRHGNREFGFHYVLRREDDVVIGEIGFVGQPEGGAVMIGYAIAPEARRQGYATEAIVAVTEWALAQPEVEQVRAQTLPDNEPSIRALLRAGFEEDEPAARVRRFVRSSAD
jgi:RimJ/RimL family protein N-acetyltransferase